MSDYFKQESGLRLSKKAKLFQWKYVIFVIGKSETIIPLRNSIISREDEMGIGEISMDLCGNPTILSGECDNLKHWGVL